MLASKYVAARGGSRGSDVEVVLEFRPGDTQARRGIGAGSHPQARRAAMRPTAGGRLLRSCRMRVQDRRVWCDRLEGNSW